jgi:outer membrane protein
MKTIKIITLFLLCVTVPAVADDYKVGFVNFKRCVEKAKLGKKEKDSFETLKKQMGDGLEKMEKEITEMSKKFEDSDYREGLSPTAEEEMKQKYQKLSQEYARNQNQCYQLLNQANFKMLQGLQESVAKAAERVRDKHKLDFILTDDAAFAFAPSIDYTDDVIKELDHRFDIENEDADTGKTGKK